MGDWFTVLIPTRDSAAWIATLLGHYQAQGITPVLLLDDRTKDDTRAIAQSFGAPVTDIHGFTHTEAIVSVAKDIVKTPWALFVHDDEMPSAKLFARLRGPQPPDEVQTVALPRRWAWYEPGKPLMYGFSPQWQDRAGDHGRDHHWRLFRPARVTYAPAMHSDGFYIGRWSRMPRDTYLVHFEWVLRSAMQRRYKLWKYDEIRWGYGKFFEKLYLPEAQPPGVIEYHSFETDEFDQLAQAYYAARGPDPVIPPPSLRTRLTGLMNAMLTKIRPTNFSKEPADRKGLDAHPEWEVQDPANAG